MTPGMVRLAKELLDARASLSAFHVARCPSGQGGLELYDEVSEAGSCSRDHAYLPEDLTRELVDFAQSRILEKLKLLGVEL